jgi:hypothetical protein
MRHPSLYRLRGLQRIFGLPCFIEVQFWVPDDGDVGGKPAAAMMCLSSSPSTKMAWCAYNGRRL